MLQDIERVAALDVEDDFFEPDAALRPERRVLRVVPVEVLHRLQSSTTCAHEAHVGIGTLDDEGVPLRENCGVSAATNCAGNCRTVDQGA